MISVSSAYFHNPTEKTLCFSRKSAPEPIESQKYFEPFSFIPTNTEGYGRITAYDLVFEKDDDAGEGEK